MKIKIQTPTLGRVVLCSLPTGIAEVSERAQASTLDYWQQVFPGTVVSHLGGGTIRLTVAGFNGVFTAEYGEAAPGVPQVARWCYPAMVREETEIAAYQPVAPFVEHVSEDGGIISDQGAAALNSPVK